MAKQQVFEVGCNADDYRPVAEQLQERVDNGWEIQHFVHLPQPWNRDRLLVVAVHHPPRVLE